MPWVRLHGTKDYIGMALHIQEVPEFHCTINLVPSLLIQIERYVHGGSDRHLDISRKDAGDLDAESLDYLLDHFFMANVDTMIRPHPRYYELYRRRNVGNESAAAVRSRYSAQDLRDLQVWNNLTWIHELVMEGDPELQEFRRQGQGWTENEKHWLLDRQREILARIIPLHKQLADSGQIELTTTPFYHPILPLLWDKHSARQAMPGCELPRYLQGYPEDVHRQLRSAVEYHEQLFGRKPAGMWPSEGSVSQEIIAPIADAGIQWIASDEEILSHSTGGFITRDPQGLINHPEKLFQPWQCEHDGRTLQMIFRDHGLSDQIGFHYQRSDPITAADDLLNRVSEIGQSVNRLSGDQPALVPIILDGENCWEHYPDGGVTFLRRLYRQSVARPEIHPVRVCDHLQAYPAQERITTLFAGSWIFHNFAIWIGHEEDRRAWDLLHETRRHLVKMEAQGTLTSQQIRDAWREIDIAEGSDWFWWYGDDHNSDLDWLFDQLFRRHLENVYRILGETPPTVLSRPIGGARQRVLHTLPRKFLDVHLDGQAKFFEWANAGRYTAGSERGTMTLVSRGMIREILFGFDQEHLLILIRTTGKAALDLKTMDSLRIRFVDPEETELIVQGWDQQDLKPILRKNHEGEIPTSATVAAQQVVELSIPFADLGVAPEDPLSFFVEVLESGSQSLDRAPSEGTINLRTPSKTFEAWNWQA